MSEQEKLSEKKHGFLEINSYSISQGLINFNVGAFGAYVFFFYETEVLLNVILLALAMSLYSAWDAINDPWMGNLTDRPFKFTEKWGRRFPWVAIGVFPWAILYIFIFTTPDVDPNTGGWLIFTYLLFILIIYDTFYTVWNINSEALMPFKFRNYDERRKVSGIKAIWGIIGLVLGIAVPPLFVEYGVKSSYVTQAIILAIIIVILGILMLPGHREDKALIIQYLKSAKELRKNVSFFKALVEALKKKNFLIMITLHFLYSILTGLLIASGNYILRYNLKEDPSAFLLVMLAYLIVSLLTIPIWIKVAQKVNNNKLMITIGSIVMGTMTLLIMLVDSLTMLIIVVALIGLGGGIFFVMQDVINADVIDEAVVLDGERREGTYFGIKFFIGRFSNVFVFVAIAVIHIATGFNPVIENQTPLALLGIKIHMSLIPGIALLIGAIIFWKWYDLTPEKMDQVKDKIIQLKF
jgi:GPH family glycoside/pentoside/hexuronide:cation symporter